MRSVTKILPFVAILAAGCQSSWIEVDADASVKDTNTSILGVNHIGLSVRDLDTTLAFYQQATGFELVRREKVSQNENADRLFGRDNVAYEVAVLKAPNMLLELTEFEHNQNARIGRMPAKGPGMTHTCFQSPASDPGWDKFIRAGASALTWGGEPVDLGGYGVTYGYAYDPEGNMMELEQLDGAILARSGYDATWKEQGYEMWMSQVALATPDIDRLMGYYQDVLGFKPYRIVELSDNPRADKIVGYEKMHVLGGWFRMDASSKVIEFWQYKNPVTPKPGSNRDVTAPGYSFSLEVGDIEKEYERLTAIGVSFVGRPVKLGDFWQAYAHDPDGNVFSLRQAVDPESVLSVRQFDFKKRSD